MDTIFTATMWVILTMCILISIFLGLELIPEMIENWDKRKARKAQTNEKKIPETVKCEECRCLIEKSDAQELKEKIYGWHLFYCQVHRRKFSSLESPGLGMPIKYYEEIEVDSNGKPIGYIKAPEKVKYVKTANYNPHVYSETNWTIPQPKKRGRPRKI